MLPYLVFLKKRSHRTFLDIRVCCYHDQVRGFYGANLILSKNIQLTHSFLPIHIWSYNLKWCDISSYLNKATRFNIVRSSTESTFGYPNLMLSLLQYIGFYFNIKIYSYIRWLSNCGRSYVVLRTFTYTWPSSPS